MFSHVVLTAPNEKIATVFKTQLSHLLNEYKCGALAGAEVHCFADPAGVRIGSGGGTLHAVLSLIEASGLTDFSRQRVLIIHSGGDARRSPMYSVCGKAWMTLNMILDQGNSETITSALLLLFDQIHGLSSKCPFGSLVIASSDVLLSLAQNWEACDIKCDDNQVYIVTVPANITTAKNHGVLFGKTLQTLDGASKDMVTCPVDLYLQKPSIEKMYEENVVLPYEQTLIDTGLVVLTGEAFNALINLRHSPLVDDHGQPNKPLQNDYIRFELYTELLIACVTSTNEHYTFLDYVQALGLSVERLSKQMKSGLEVLWSVFHQYPLKMICFPRGKFLHLGTSREVFDLLVPANEPASAGKALWYPTSSVMHSTIQSLSQHISATSSSTIVNSLIFYNNPEAWTKSFIEHSALVLPDTSSSDGCFISHIVHPQLLSNASIPRQLIIQEVPLQPSKIYARFPSLSEETIREKNFFCLISQHIDDNTKAAVDTGTVGGISWSTFFEQTHCSVEDIWCESIAVEERSLWNASLFPVFVSHITDPNHNSSSFFSLLSSSGNLIAIEEISSVTPSLFLQILRLLQDPSSSSTIETDDKLDYLIGAWKNSARLSLAEIITYGSAESLFLWREMISSFTKQKIRLEDKTDALLPTIEFECFLQIYHRWQQTSSVFTKNDISSPAEIASVLLIISFLQKFVEEDKSAAAHNDLFLELLSRMFPLLDKETAIATFSPYVHKYLQCAQLPNHLHAMYYQDWHIVLRVHFLRSIAMTQPSFLAQSMCVCLQMMSDSLELEPKALPRMLLAFGQLSQTIDISTPTYPSYKFPDLDIAKKIGSVSTESLLTAKEIVQQTAEQDLLTLRNSILEHMLSLLQTSSSLVDTTASSSSSSSRTFSLATYVEELAQKVTQRQIEISLHVFDAMSHEAGTDVSLPPSIVRPRMVVARAPVRIDLAGGWSDTPPICYDQAGAVFNIAVAVDGKQPLRCVASFVHTPGILVECWGRKSTSSTMLEKDEFEKFARESCLTWAELSLVAHSDSPCALPKACMLLLCLRWIHKYQEHDDSKEEDLLSFILRKMVQKPFQGIKIMCLSDLPAGSGMGGSSILAGVILHAIACLFPDEHAVAATTAATTTTTMTTTITPSHWLSSLAYMVTQVEQLMTTGGGWQDQVGGLYPGLKIARSPATLPLSISVEAIPIHKNTSFLAKWQRCFHERCCLIYTGQQRLAKDTLINALRKYSLLCSSSSSASSASSHASSTTGDLVQQLIANAEIGFQHLNEFFQIGNDNVPEGEEKEEVIVEKIHQEIDRLGHVLQR